MKRQAKSYPHVANREVRHSRNNYKEVEKCSNHRVLEKTIKLTFIDTNRQLTEKIRLTTRAALMYGSPRA